jgi:CHASE3 domain sensor protein
MDNMKLEKELRKNIREYFKRVQQTMTQQQELKDLLKRISPSLKKKVQSCMFVTALGKNCVIQETQRMILSAHAAPEVVTPG